MDLSFLVSFFYAGLDVGNMYKEGFWLEQLDSITLENPAVGFVAFDPCGTPSCCHFCI